MRLKHRLLVSSDEKHSSTRTAEEQKDECTVPRIIWKVKRLILYWASDKFLNDNLLMSVDEKLYFNSLSCSDANLRENDSYIFFFGSLVLILFRSCQRWMLSETGETAEVLNQIANMTRLKNGFMSDRKRTTKDGE